jgi:DNA-binding transcriptional LysR family regulator
MDWNDLQTIEALVRLGTLEGAARALGLTHSTVSRRLAAIEARVATSLFVRGARLAPTPLAQQLAAEAAAMASAATQAETHVAREHRRREHRLAITTSDVLAPLLLRALAVVAPRFSVEVVIGDAELALGPGQIDLALRPAFTPNEGLRGRCLGRLRLGVFVAVAGAEHRWVMPDEALRARRSMRWWRHVDSSAAHVITCNTLLGIRDACVAGLGHAIVPSFLFHDDQRVRCVRELDDGPPVWLLSPTTEAASKENRAFRAALAAALIAVDGAFVAR